VAPVTFGLDISHHQPASLDLAQCRREGVEFVFLKSTEGSTFIDPAFVANLNEARQAGMLVAAYHYVRSNATAAAQVANVARVVPKDVPVIPDIEANSGGVALVRDIVARLQAAGYHVPLTYLPRWYWQQIGSPSLAGLPSLWSSRYPDNVVGSLTDELADVPATYWNGYGGLGVTVLQFSSSARVAGHAPLDANAYLGTRTQLAALLGGQPQEDELSWKDTWTFTAPDGTQVTESFDDILGNIYQMLFYGSTSEPWAGPSVVAHLKALAARQVADVDEEALAAAMAAQGIGGATPAQVKAALQEVFAAAAQSEGSTN
jgi:lysozyme